MKNFISLSKIGILTKDEAHKRPCQGAYGRICGQIQGVQERKSAKGNKFAFVQMDDPTGTFEITLFSQILESSRDYLFKGSNSSKC